MSAFLSAAMANQASAFAAAAGQYFQGQKVFEDISKEAARGKRKLVVSPSDGGQSVINLGPIINAFMALGYGATALPVKDGIQPQIELTWYYPKFLCRPWWVVSSPKNQRRGFTRAPTRVLT